MEPAYAIRRERLEALIRLLGNAAVVGPDLATKRRFLVSGLAALVDASVWVWAHARTQPDGSIYHYAFLDGGWRDDRQRSIGLAANHTPESAAIMAAMTREVAGHHTRMRTDYLTDEAWYSNGLFEKFRKPADLDDFMFSYYPIGPNDVSNVGLHKAMGTRPFTEEDRAIVHLVTSQVAWLHFEDADVIGKNKILQLSPRQRQIVLFLLGGDSIKQIAHRLKLSPNTVNNHLKLIHKAFNVSSRGELLAQFMAGGRRAGEDTSAPAIEPD